MTGWFVLFVLWPQKALVAELLGLPVVAALFDQLELGLPVVAALFDQLELGWSGQHCLEKAQLALSCSFVQACR